MPDSRQARAEKQADHAEQVGLAGASRGVRLLIQYRDRVLSRFAQGDSIDGILMQANTTLAEGVADSMTAAHLRGRLDVLLEASGHLRRTGKRLDRLSEVRSFLEARLQLQNGEVEAVKRVYGPRAVEVSSTLTDSVNRRLLDAVSESVRLGEHRRDGMNRLREAFDAAGITVGNPYQVETVFRTYSNMAYSAGAVHADRDPAVDVILASYTYSTVGDDRVRPTHAAMEGVTRPKDDPVWREWTPPCDWGCRCTLLRNWADENPANTPVPNTIEVGGQTVAVRPGDGFRFNPADAFEDVLSRLATGPRRIAAAHDGLKPSIRVLAAALEIEREQGRDPYLREIAERLGKARATITHHVSTLDSRGLMRHSPASHGCVVTNAGRMAVAAATALV